LGGLGSHALVVENNPFGAGYAQGSKPRGQLLCRTGSADSDVRVPKPEISNQIEPGNVTLQVLLLHARVGTMTRPFKFSFNHSGSTNHSDVEADDDLQ